MSVKEDAQVILARHNVKFAGTGRPTLLFAHGYGCDHGMWRHITSRFSPHYRTATYDLVGCGGSQAVYDEDRYATLDGYVADLLDIRAAMGPEPVVLVGHSVSAMIGALAAIRAPTAFQGLAMVGPSPFYMQDGAYDGDFTAEDIESLLALLDADHAGWAATMAPIIMANGDQPELAEELAASVCRMDSRIARRFARLTFSTDLRPALPRIRVPVLVLQCSEDIIAPVRVGEYVHRHVPDSRYVLLRATGHCPHLSAPGETAPAILDFVRGLPSVDAHAGAS